MTKEDDAVALEPGLRDGIFYTGDKGPKVGVRYLQVFLLAVCYGNAYATKGSFSVALVAMTDNSTSPNPNVPTYDWKNTNVIISSILWSGIPFTFFAGYLGKQYGPKWILVVGTTINSIFFLLIPAAAQLLGSTGVIICRIIQGVALSFVNIQSSVVMGRWAPPEERSRMGYIVGGIVTIIAMGSSVANGQLAETYWGWPSIFYIIGSIGIVIAGVIAIFGAQSAQTHPRITLEERQYLETTLFNTNIEYKTPWMKIFKSVHCWAIIIGVSGYSWFVTLMSTEFSVFLAKVFNFDLSSTGTIAALPSLIGAAAGLPLSYFSDYLPRKGFISVINSRRSFHLLGVTGISIAMFCMTFVPIEHRNWTVGIICIAEPFIMMAGVGGAGVNTLDISPKYAGIISGIESTFSSTLAIFAPLVVDWVCGEYINDISRWRIVFVIAGAFAIGTAIFFALFATDQRQNWDDENEEEEGKERRKSPVIDTEKSIGA
ncbi:putative inorganic phosphate cotransporter [Euwallacea similis]|uniref:putative inorganic phosphate cotransporter n=1 Tax=Euwallacea similis TaxID=1736056 RepID=UPI00344BA402